MVNPAETRKQARVARERAHTLSAEVRALAGITGSEDLAESKKTEAADLLSQYRKLMEKSRLETVSVRQGVKVKRSKNGEKAYPYWVTSWKKGGKVITTYLGSCAKMSENEALERAQRLKTEALERAHDIQS